MKKLKDHYKHPKPCGGIGNPYVYYYRLGSVCFRQFSTLQEKSYYHLHRYEYREFGLHLRAARGKMLPSSWDDFPSDVDNVAKSWKHNSRRRHQYYR
ncbi:hypothetical protein [Nissabacter archeti]|uniref:Uncharacterized protein n=1 Tax=Nissabacter archeti TaxID=1917880 RepID=A0ABS5JLE7_9GAMM|nr:hypothetical protein [Nissabacter archeti]MBS0970755.1 hypothetical protein [Nissabacter archeti]